MRLKHCSARAARPMKYWADSSSSYLHTESLIDRTFLLHVIFYFKKKASFSSFAVLQVTNQLFH